MSTAAVPELDAPPPAGTYRLVPHKTPLKTLWRLSDRGFLFLVAAAVLKVFRYSPGEVHLRYPAELEDVGRDHLDDQAKFSLDALRYELRERGFTPGPVVRQVLDDPPLPEVIALSANRSTALYATFIGPPEITLLSLRGRGEGLLTTNTRVMQTFENPRLEVDYLPEARLSRLIGAHEDSALPGEGSFRTFDFAEARAAICSVRDLAMERMIDRGMLERI